MFVLYFQVGCGLSNMHNLRDALLTQTKHVQFVIFERANQVRVRDKKTFAFYS